MLDCRFQLAKKLGKGASSDVYMVTDNDDVEYAVKIHRKPIQKTSLNIMSELQKEYLVMELLNQHPNVLKCYGHFCDSELFVDGQYGKVHYNLMEYAKNGTLSSLIRTRGYMIESAARFYACQIASAVHFMHNSKIANLDIKPQNILLDEFMNAKVADFGTCEVDTSNTGLCLQRKGTPKYMAPEVDDFSRKDAYNMFAADVYSLGVTFYFLVTGETPCTLSTHEVNTKSSGCSQTGENGVNCSFQDTLSKLGISDELADLIKSMTEPLPEDRPTMEEVMNHPWFSLDYLYLSPEEVYNSSI